MFVCIIKFSEINQPAARVAYGKKLSQSADIGMHRHQQIVDMGVIERRGPRGGNLNDLRRGYGLHGWHHTTGLALWHGHSRLLRLAGLAGHRIIGSGLLTVLLRWLRLRWLAVSRLTGLGLGRILIVSQVFSPAGSFRIYCAVDCSSIPN